MAMTYMLMIVVALTQPMQIVNGFPSRASCEAALKQVKQEFKPHAVACIELNPDAGKK